MQLRFKPLAVVDTDNSKVDFAVDLIWKIFLVVKKFNLI